MSGGQSGLVMLKEILARSLTGLYRGLRDSNQKGQNSLLFFDCYIVVVTTKKKGT